MIKHTASTKSFILACVALIIAGCGGGSSNDQPSSPPASTVTISGVVADGSISGAAVAVLDPDGQQIAAATTDTDGRFAAEVTEGDLDGGYLVRVSGGEIGGSTLIGQLTAMYGPGESYDSANATIVTTLVFELAELEGAGTLVERRDAVIQLLSDIGLFLADEWNLGAPAEVNVLEMRADMAIGGVTPIVDALIADLRDAQLDAASMAYFPAAHGGITYLSLASRDNVVSGFPGGVVSESVVLLGSVDRSNYEFTVVDGPSGLEVDATGALLYAVQDSAVANGQFPFAIQVTNTITGKGRTLDGSVFVMAAESFEFGAIGPEGGTLREPVNRVEIVVPPGSVDSEVSVSLLRGRSAEGNLILEIRSTADVAGAEIYLPDPEQLTRAVGDSYNEMSAIAGDLPPAQADFTDYPADLWREQWAWFRSTARIARQIPFATIFAGNGDVIAAPPWQAEARVASELSCSEPVNSDLDLRERIPVLFVHGYTLFGGIGGGDRTWGQFPSRVGQLGSGDGNFLPCEFRYRTNARFQVVAEDLRNAIEQLVNRTGMQVHIVAHSFGGVLARTYLQGLADSSIDDYAKPVASLTTLGTPHSGIAGSQTSLYGEEFPDGQDSNTIINGALQLSAYQTGEPLGWTLSALEKREFGLRADAGFIAASLRGADHAEVGGIFPFPEGFPIQVLIGVRSYRLCALRTCTYYLRGGDGLITYEGQRFHPDLTTGSTTASLLNEESWLGARVTEYVLGTDDDLRPPTESASPLLNPELGFSHNILGDRPLTERRLREAQLECETVVATELVDGEVVEAETGCDFHDAFRRVRLWLATVPSEPVSSSFGDPADTSTTDVQISVGEVDASGGPSDVRMYASVVTQNGVPLDRLTAGNFLLIETINGQARNVPLSSVSLEPSSGKAVVLAIDRSGSMVNSIDDARAAATAFIDNMQPGDQAAVIDFAGDVVIRQGFTRDRALLQSAIDSVDVGAWSGTAAYDAAYEGLELSREVFGNRAVLLLTDGDDLSSSTTVDQLTAHATSLGVPIYTIGLGVTVGSTAETALIQIADGSNAGSDGSGYYPAPTTAGLATLYRAISDVLSNTYRISWQSSGSSGDSVLVQISVEYQTANGTFSDSTSATYTVP